MSWSVNFIDKPEKVVIALITESEKMSGQSKVEFDSALPHLIALVTQNFGVSTPSIKLNASGHGIVIDEIQTQRQFWCSIEHVYSIII